MVMILGGLVLFQPRNYLYASKFDSWPSMKERNRFALDCSYSDKASVMTALGLVERRNDVDVIDLEFTHLLDDEIRPLLDKLFKKKPWKWRVYVVSGVPLPANIDRSRLQTVLSILKPVRFLRLTFHSTFHSSFHSQADRSTYVAISQCLPKLDNLEFLDLGYWELDQYALQDVLGCPFLPVYTRVCLEPKLPINDPVFPDETACRIHSIDLNMFSKSPEVATALLQAVTRLPVLNELSVELPYTKNIYAYAEPLSIFYAWLGSPKCQLTNLIFSSCVANELMPVLLTTIPKIPLLKALRLNLIYLDCFDNFFHAISKSPNLSCIYLGCYLDKTVLQKFLKFQLDWRPRLLSIAGIKQSGLDLCHSVSLVYQTIQSFQQSSEKGSFPMSAWPYFLELLGDRMHNQSRTVHQVGLDSIFQALILSSYTIDWNLVLAIHPVTSTNRK